MCRPEGLVDAAVESRDDAAVPPLTCVHGRRAVPLDWYRPASRSFVATDADGTPIGTHLHAGALVDRIIDVRDETSAPVARFEPSRSGDDRLVETGGGVLATGSRRDVVQGSRLEDEWSLTTRTDDLPMKPLAFATFIDACRRLGERVANDGGAGRRQWVERPGTNQPLWTRPSCSL